VEEYCSLFQVLAGPELQCVLAEKEVYVLLVEHTDFLLVGEGLLLLEERPAQMLHRPIRDI
jgi:hypothetical protein